LTKASRHESPPSPVYFGASGTSHLTTEVVDMARSMVDHPVKLEVLGGDSFISYAPGPSFDIEPTRAELGYEPEYDIKAGLLDYMDWCRRNPGARG
jgi:nucleoside-diphosphate-sugar epimerase